jgi:cystathionine beta-lyase/cystathionine gamma-synthase
MTPRDAQGLSTRAIHGGRVDNAFGSILTPIYQSTTYVQEALGQHKGYTYSRANNPTVAALERALGTLEGTPPAVCFSSGMAAVATLFLSLLGAGDHVVVSDVVYGGTVRLLRRVLERLGVGATFVDTASADAVRQALTPRTRLIFIESPANPTLKLADIEAIATGAHAADVRVAVDNTFLTPVLQPVFGLGADISVLSTTKYIEGHNATIGGSLATPDESLLDQFRLIRKTLGTIQSPLDAWLTMRGLKTLPMRLQCHSANAITIARWLEQHPRVRSVRYPGLDSFPQRALAECQHIAHGGIIAFELDGGADAGIAFMNSVRLCALAENLGAVETLVTHPATMTHADVPAPTRAKLGIGAGLIRLSVGLEDPADIMADLDHALAASQFAAPNGRVS